MEIKNSERWNSGEIVDKLADLQSQAINLLPVLQRFTPNHVHWHRRYQPWYFRFRPEIFECFPVIDKIIETTYSTYLGLHGLPTQSNDIGGQLIFPKKDSHWPAEKVLMFPWIDFIVLPKSTEKVHMFATMLDTTRIVGSIYQVNIRYIDHLKDDFSLEQEEQELIASMQAARE